MKVRKGFTLVELLIVLAIIGVLMSIGIPIYTNQLEKAKARVIASNLRTITQSLVNSIMLGYSNDIPGSNKATITGNDIKQIVKGIKNVSDYEASFVISNGEATVGAWYTGSDVGSETIANELNGVCDATDSVTMSASFSSHAACIIKQVPIVGF